MDQSNDKRLERRAKNMILNKKIPPSKMEAVRALLKNEGLNPHEKYSAVIQLIKGCPDKPQVNLEEVEPKRPVATVNNEIKKSNRRYALSANQTAAPTKGAAFIDTVYMQLKKYGLFKKRWLIRANNVLKFWFKKRLIPTPRFFKVMNNIISYQEKLLERLPEIMNAIIEDPEIDKPLIYNYLRELRSWMLENPFKKMGYTGGSWLGVPSFESEITKYLTYYFSFNALDNDVKENIILTVESMLRKNSSLKKFEILESDEKKDRTFKQKENLSREKKIYEYIMVLRSFLISENIGESKLDKLIYQLSSIKSLEQFLIFTVDALVFQHRTTMPEIYAYFDIRELKVDSSKWDCSNDLLKKTGKDPESLRKKRLELYRSELAQLDEIIEYINTKYDGKDLLSKAFDDHWHIISKRRQEYGNYPEDNFFFYLDDCIDYFFHAFIPFLDGTTMLFTDINKNNFESSIFSTGFFEGKITALTDLQRELLDYRTKNPNSLISYEEIKRIMSGKLASMTHIKSYVEHIGSLFFMFASELHFILRNHTHWTFAGAHPSDAGLTRQPLAAGLVDDRGEERGTPIPFYNCRIAKQENAAPIVKMFTGKFVVSDSVRDGVFKHITAFCYQMAYECMDHSINQMLDRRRDIKRRIQEIV